VKVEHLATPDDYVGVSKRGEQPLIYLGMSKEAVLLESYRALARQLVLALAGTAPKGQVIAHVEHALCTHTAEPTDDMAIDETEAMADLARGTDRPARLLRLVEAAIARRLVTEPEA
jgi:hypothetical protein